MKIFSLFMMAVLTLLAFVFLIFVMRHPNTGSLGVSFCSIGAMLFYLLYQIAAKQEQRKKLQQLRAFYNGEFRHYRYR
jgi:lipopolysaccharide export LptBFGC system permease protein LptF